MGLIGRRKLRSSNRPNPDDGGWPPTRKDTRAPTAGGRSELQPTRGWNEFAAFAALPNPLRRKPLDAKNRTARFPVTAPLNSSLMKTLSLVLAASLSWAWTVAAGAATAPRLNV